jgi:branched-chain amino acid transport system permease protein
MIGLIAYIVDGLSMGALYGLLALALVINYRSTRLINFAQGELAMLSVYLCLTFLGRMTPWLAVPLTLVTTFFIGVLVELLLLRRFKDGRDLNAVILTVGVFTVINSVVLWVYGPIQKSFPSPFGDGVTWFGKVGVSNQSIGAFLAALLILFIFFLIFQHTQIGLALRGVSQNWLAARVVGIRVEGMFSLGWGMAAVLGASAGMLVAPKLFVFPSMMQSVLIYSFAAAVVGGLESPLGAVLGGLLLGVVESLAAAWPPIGNDLKTVVAMGVLVMVLAIRPRGVFGRRKARQV